MSNANPIVLSENDVKRFLLMVPMDKGPNECWISTDGLTPRGYSRITLESGNRVLKHRASFVAFKGPIPDRKDICHDCPSGDNPSCWNPHHLWPGTQAENVRDCVVKGRNCRGERMSVIMKAIKALEDPERRRQIVERRARNTSGENSVHSKLSNRDVACIRELRARGFTYSSMSIFYPVKIVQLYRIATGKRWRWHTFDGDVSAEVEAMAQRIVNAPVAPTSSPQPPEPALPLGIPSTPALP